MIVRYTNGSGEITTRLACELTLPEAAALVALTDSEGWTPVEQSALERIAAEWRIEEGDRLLRAERVGVGE